MSISTLFPYTLFFLVSLSLSLFRDPFQTGVPPSFFSLVFHFSLMKEPPNSPSSPASAPDFAIAFTSMMPPPPPSTLFLLLLHGSSTTPPAGQHILSHNKIEHQQRLLLGSLPPLLVITLLYFYWLASASAPASVSASTSAPTSVSTFYSSFFLLSFCFCSGFASASSCLCLLRILLYVLYCLPSTHRFLLLLLVACTLSLQSPPPSRQLVVSPLSAPPSFFPLQLPPMLRWNRDAETNSSNSSSIHPRTESKS